MFYSVTPQFNKDVPLFHIGQIPVRLITLLIALHTGVMVATSLLLASGRASWINLLLYSSDAVWHGQVWRLVTYAFVSLPSIWFALEMLMLYYFGRAVEGALGVKFFSLLYVGLIFLGSGFLQLLSLTGASQEMSGAQAVNFAIFAAFVAIVPGAQFFFGLAARWMLLILLALSSLQLLAGHQFSAMLLFITESVGAVLFMKWRGFHELFWGLPSFSLFKIMKRTKAPSSPVKSSLNRSILTTPTPLTTNASVSKSTPSPKAVLSKSVKKVQTEAIDIDLLLEKIGHAGIASLTLEEKEQLEKARTALLQRDRS